MRRWMTIGSAALLLACLATPLRAQPRQDQGDMQTTVEALKQRLREQDRRIREQEARLAELEESRRAGATSQDAQREAIKKVLAEMKTDASTRSNLPGWLDNLKFGGDFRLRYQGDCFNWGSTDSAQKKTRSRARYRLRVGATKTWLDDQLEVVFRLASGESEDPTSTNQSFTGNYSDKPVWIDLAYAKYSPSAVKGLSVTGGKMKNPWRMNEIFMDSDVNPEGFWAEYQARKFGSVQPFVGAGYFVLRESSSDFDTTMYGVQGGVKWDVAKDVRYTAAGYWQDYDHYDTSGASARGNDSPLTHVPSFGVIGLANSLEIKAFGRPLSFYFDWAHNCAEADSVTDYAGANNAYYAGVKYGKNKKKGDWSAKYCYAYVEANSLPGNFVDSDFGHANRKGHVLKGEYNLLDDLTVGAALLLTEPIFSPTTTSGSSAYEDRTVTAQVDLVWKF
ncbi:MAG TPA: putative porin [Phycisphaerae bacterium]|nr:putative porin [Phycisphaerae bacterium]